ncbi:hypothetical protein HII36_01770 [Nonomuraea sp. NN258]|uniref:hypothetical protein n=1 Tax=Nonomuraea antri TaxID=2730852 RepID=UPI001568CB50|nr:hypothetical protein [Nonomuraea antri]NRQ30575.1 hypothetical protein [Nonomuraea antri]
MNPPFSAYVDESMRIQQGLYLMAAVLVAPARAEAHRAALRSLLLRRQPRLHWRDENDKRRAQLVEALAGLRLRGIVLVGTGLDRKRQERARRKVMECLLWELGNRHVREVVFEQRDRRLDAQDHDMIVTLKGRHAITSRLQVAWRSPCAECGQREARVPVNSGSTPGLTSIPPRRRAAWSYCTRSATDSHPASGWSKLAK